MTGGACVVCLEALPRRRWWQLLSPVPVHRWCRPLLHASIGDAVGEDGVRRLKSAEFGQITMTTWPTV